MQLNRAGLIFSGIYAALAALLFFVYFTTQDTKGAFVAGQIAVIPGVMLLSSLGLDQWIWAHPWINNYPVFFLLSLLLCYLIGWACSCVARLLGNLLKSETPEAD